VAALELPQAGQREPEPQDTWRRRSPPQQGGEAQSYSLRGSAWIHALLLALSYSMRGNPVFMVPTVAPGPTSGEAANPQVGPIFQRPLGYLDIFTRQSTTGLREVPELKVWERPRST
jgi:hypothetical protein